MDFKLIYVATRGYLKVLSAFCVFCGALIFLSLSFSSAQFVPPTSSVTDGLSISDNHHYLLDAKTGAPVFILADTAWNLGALKVEEIDTYLQNRQDHGFNTIMFALNFFPQAAENEWVIETWFYPLKTSTNRFLFVLLLFGIVVYLANHQRNRH